jgi:nitrilase
VISQEMIDLMCDTPDNHQLIHVGGGFTVIYGPDGARIGDKLAPDQEGNVYADINLAMIPVAKAAADPAGHYARPDVTRPLFNYRSPGSIDIQVPTGRKWRRVCV